MSNDAEFLAWRIERVRTRANIALLIGFGAVLISCAWGLYVQGKIPPPRGPIELTTTTPPLPAPSPSEKTVRENPATAPAAPPIVASTTAEVRRTAPPPEPVAARSAATSSAPARKIDWREALRDAAKAVPHTQAFSDAEMVQHGLDTKQEVLLAYYLKFLERGGLAAEGGELLRAATIAVARRLTDVDREAWLREVLSHCDPDDDFITVQWGKMAAAGTYPYALYANTAWPQDTIEAIYNLSTDGNLRLNARDLWDECFVRYRESGNPFANDPPVRYMPPHPAIPVWR